MAQQKSTCLKVGLELRLLAAAGWFVIMATKVPYIVSFSWILAHLNSKTHSDIIRTQIIIPLDVGKKKPPLAHPMTQCLSSLITYG